MLESALPYLNFAAQTRLSLLAPPRAPQGAHRRRLRTRLSAEEIGRRLLSITLITVRISWTPRLGIWWTLTLAAPVCSLRWLLYGGT